MKGFSSSTYSSKRFCAMVVTTRKGPAVSLAPLITRAALSTFRPFRTGFSSSFVSTFPSSLVSPQKSRSTPCWRSGPRSQCAFWRRLRSRARRRSTSLTRSTRTQTSRTIAFEREGASRERGCQRWAEATVPTSVVKCQIERLPEVRRSKVHPRATRPVSFFCPRQLVDVRRCSVMLRDARRRRTWIAIGPLNSLEPCRVAQRGANPQVCLASFV
mmetsp:Transcript_3591/g.11080  ORF Transcript_3591/g.11080 Transcript_3591/m.11080 type:complete len:215 (+) Transcript_3591:498-1142(+)